MAAKHSSIPFSQRVESFGKSIYAEKRNQQPIIVLVIVASTLDEKLSIGCEKDVRAVKGCFKKIALHLHFDFSCIEVVDEDFCWENVDQSIEAIMPKESPYSLGLDDLVVFYFSGHGFSYRNDGKRRWYPQLDLRPPIKHDAYDKIEFIENNTMNILDLLTYLRTKSGRICLAIADCCNTKIPFDRSENYLFDMRMWEQLLPKRRKYLTKELFLDHGNEICLLVSSSQPNQPAISDPEIGSIFTHHFTQTLLQLLTEEPPKKRFIPWLKYLRRAANKAFKDSKGYDIGDGKAGNQQAIFEVFIEDQAAWLERAKSFPS